MNQPGDSEPGSDIRQSRVIEWPSRRDVRAARSIAGNGKAGDDDRLCAGPGSWIKLPSQSVGHSDVSKDFPGVLSVRGECGVNVRDSRRTRIRGQNGRNRPASRAQRTVKTGKLQVGDE